MQPDTAFEIRNVSKVYQGTRRVSKHPDAISKIFYSQPTQEDRAMGKFDHEGRMNLKDFESLLTPDYDIYVCGPVAFMEVLIQELKLKGIPDSQIRAETFDFSAEGAGTSLDTTPDALRKLKTSAGVRFEGSDRNVTWSPEQGTLLDLAEAIGIAVSSDCRMGLCGTCSTKISSGEVIHLALDGPEPAKDEALLCCAIPKTDELVLIL
jgi:ferredoxin